MFYGALTQSGLIEGMNIIWEHSRIIDYNGEVIAEIGGEMQDLYPSSDFLELVPRSENRPLSRQARHPPFYGSHSSPRRGFAARGEGDAQGEAQCSPKSNLTKCTNSAKKCTVLNDICKITKLKKLINNHRKNHQRHFFSARLQCI